MGINRIFGYGRPWLWRPLALEDQSQAKFGLVSARFGLVTCLSRVYLNYTRLLFCVVVLRCSLQDSGRHECVILWILYTVEY